MSVSHDPQPTGRRGSTTAQLKDDIDSGRTGDKVPGFDPAASPLGTDDEAGGVAHDPQLVAETRQLEAAGRPDSGNANAASPELQPDAKAPRRTHAVAILVGLALAGGLALALLAAL